MIRDKIVGFIVELEIFVKKIFCFFEVGGGVLVFWILGFDLVVIGVICFFIINVCFFLVDVKFILLIGK